MSAIRITTLNERDLDRVDLLATPNRATLGFLTREALREYLKQGGVIGAEAPNGCLIGYLLFAEYPDRFRVAQLCVAETHRRQGVAKELIEALKRRKTTQLVVKLWCRRDFPANRIWGKLGFTPLDEKAGRSASGKPLHLWCLRLAEDDQLGLWRAESSEESIRVVIDAQVFFLKGSNEPNAKTAEGLWNDFLADSLSLWITDEIFHEIHRQDCEVTRNESRKRAQGMQRVTHDPILAEHYAQALSAVLPNRGPSDRSDINHLAKTAAGSEWIKHFVTMDEGILRRKGEIEALIGVSVVHPVDLILRFHELAQAQSMSPARISGMSLRWRRLSNTDCEELPSNAFQNDGERLGALRAEIRRFLADPESFQCEGLVSHGEIEAIRVTQRPSAEILRVPLLRINRSNSGEFICAFVLSDLMAVAVREGRSVTAIDKAGMSRKLEHQLVPMEFYESGDCWARATLAEVLGGDEVLARVARIDESLATVLSFQSPTRLEQACAPLLVPNRGSCFVVPILPAFAMGLIDRRQAAEDLFGGDPSTLLRWDNVYYRKKSRHKMLTSPGRIFWYVSRDVGEVVAISHLDEVMVKKAKELFRRYNRFGVLEWRDLWEMCGKDSSREIMALRFSRTFMFRRPIPYRVLRRVLQEENLGCGLMSPIKISNLAATRIFQYGFETQA